jgi:hypothetical protein
VSNLDYPTTEERGRRQADAAWLKAQILAIAKDLAENAREDRAEARASRDLLRAGALHRAAEVTEYHAAKLRGIARGITPDEALAQEIRTAGKVAP